MRARRSAAAALCLVLLVAACGDDDVEGTAAPGPMGAGAGPAAEAAGPDAELLAFTSRTVEGEEVDAAAFAAGRDAVVWFWSPWCGSCASEAEGVGRVAAELGAEVAFLGIAADAGQDEYEAFVEEHDLSSFPQLVDDTGEVWLRFGADTIRSSFFFLDDTGEISVTGYGELDEDELRERVRALLAS